MLRRVMLLGGGAVLALGAAWFWQRRGTPEPALPGPRAPVPLAELDAAYAPLARPEGPMPVYHLGHSLVGRDMPAFLAQMAGHPYDSQLGWGTPLRAHWEADMAINGFEAENDHPRFRPVREALASGDYDAVVLTEMVSLEDAIRWHASPHYLALWADYARDGNPDARIYLYESWHGLDIEGGWLERIDGDLSRLWEGEVLQGAAAWGAQSIHVIPAGQVMAASARAAEAGQIPGLSRREDLMRKNPDGSQDPIHPSDLGNYIVALTHYAVLYHRSPEGLPHALTRADGSSLEIPPDTAAALQRLTWQVVSATPRTGIAP